MLACRLMWKLHNMCSVCASHTIYNTAAQSCMQQYIWPHTCWLDGAALLALRMSVTLLMPSSFTRRQTRPDNAGQDTCSLASTAVLPVFDKRLPCKVATVMQQHNSDDTQQPRTFSFVRHLTCLAYSSESDHIPCRSQNCLLWSFCSKSMAAWQ